MEKSNEIKTGIFVNNIIKESYNKSKKSDSRKFLLRIISVTRKDGYYKYYFEMRKNCVPIYKRGLNTNNPSEVRNWLRNTIIRYMSYEYYHFCSLNERYNNNVLSIYFKSNFSVEITYDEGDKDFFKDLFENNQYYIQEYKNKKSEKKLSKKINN